MFHKGPYPVVSLHFLHLHEAQRSGGYLSEHVMVNHQPRYLPDYPQGTNGLILAWSTALPTAGPWGSCGDVASGLMDEWLKNVFVNSVTHGDLFAIPLFVGVLTSLACRAWTWDLLLRQAMNLFKFFTRNGLQRSFSISTTVLSPSLPGLITNRLATLILSMSS